MPIDWNVTVLAALGIGLLVGVGVGVLLRGRSGSADRARAEQLEGELEQTREDLDAHRDEVARHFQGTSDLFRDVTEQYSRLYTHLADGARAFSTDAMPALEGLETPLLAHADEAPAADEDSEPAVAAAGEPAAASAQESAASETSATEIPGPGEHSATSPDTQAAATAPPASEPLPSVKPNGGLGAPPPPAPPA